MTTQDERCDDSGTQRHVLTIVITQDIVDGAVFQEGNLGLIVGKWIKS
jgi:hypothetical protein